MKNVKCKKIKFSIKTAVHSTGGSCSAVEEIEDAYKGIFIPQKDKNGIIFAVSIDGPPGAKYRTYVIQEAESIDGLIDAGEISIPDFIVKAIKVFIGSMNIIKTLLANKGEQEAKVSQMTLPN